MADFDWANEGGLAALGAGIKGFAQGMMDGEDRKMKRLEMESKSEAQKFERERNAFLDQMTMREKGYKKDASGQAVPDVAHRTGEAITKLAPSGLEPEVDAEGNVTRVNPNASLIAAKRKGDGTAPPVKDDPFSTDLRTKWMNDPTTKATREVSTAYSKMLKASSAPSAAGDLSLIFGYMKMQDPGSTVREGEQATASNAAGIPDQLRNTYERVRTGQRLTPEQRDDFINQARNMYSTQMEQQRGLNESIKGIAQRRGLRGEDIVLEDMFQRPIEPPPKEKVQMRGGGPQANPQGLLGVGKGLLEPKGMLGAPATIAQPQTAGPDIGHVENGYEFLGGDPNDQKSWKKVETKAARR